jgi:UDP-3-O-[3-hydroxymyristoyl] glucosamine N-acyltransferase
LRALLTLRGAPASNCLLCGHVALGGSSTLGDGVIMAGKSAVKDWVSIAAGVRIAAKAGVTADITRPGDYAGFPAVPAAVWRRREAMMRRAAHKHVDAPPPHS